MRIPFPILQLQRSQVRGLLVRVLDPGVATAAPALPQ
jgi:hypothetical protein